MKKRLQIFVSSTYLDLKQERQSAVEAILKAGHIPAGMELFAAGDVSQMEAIKRWIDESDVYMLILGGRYGSIESTANKSYIELEYDYAASKGKALFAVVVSDKSLEHRRVGPDAPTHFEQSRLEDYYSLRRKVLSKISSFFDEPKDIKLAIHETLGDLINTRDFVGWVSGADVAEPKPLIDEIGRLATENRSLRSELETARKKIAESGSRDSASEPNQEDLIDTLDEIIVEIPANLSSTIKSQTSRC